MKEYFKEQVDWKKDILPLLPHSITEPLSQIETGQASEIEEIRLRAQKPISVFRAAGNFFVTNTGELSGTPENSYFVTADDCREILTGISRYSVYALQEEMRRGFVTVAGGYRIGIAGKSVLENGRIRMISPCTGFNIRLARQVKGCSDELMHFLIRGDRVLHTLLVSPPQMGKTTMLRDIARAVSNGNAGQKAKKVAIIDERSEIAGAMMGVAQNEVGYNTDLLDGCPKAEGMMMALRGLSPQVIVTDEIGRNEDIRAVAEVMNAGVSIITSIHGACLRDVSLRPGIGRLIRQKAFERIVILGERPGNILEIYDKNLSLIFNTGGGRQNEGDH